jgi:serine/threonine protein kinase
LSNRAIPFGKYLLLQRINVGGMAEVFKARVAEGDSRGRMVAIKRILPAIAADPDFINMFIDEAKISVLLDHPNIAATYELGRTAEIYYMALEYVSGKDLRSLFERKRRQGAVVPPSLAAYVVSRVAEGLDYAHRKKDRDGVPLHIIHRDISPQNVLLSFDGDVKIIDFGIAKAANKILKTQSGVLKGKFGYMSPEQVRGEEIDSRTDLFSLGTILHELLSGERLFVGTSDYAVLEKVRNAEVRPARDIRPDVPDDLDDIALRALSERDKRYQHGGELAAHLQFWLEEQRDTFAKEDLAVYLREAFPEEFDREKREGVEGPFFGEEQPGPVSQPAISLPTIRPALLQGDARTQLEGGVARPSGGPIADVYVPSVRPGEPDTSTPRHGVPLLPVDISMDGPAPIDLNAETASLRVSAGRPAADVLTTPMEVGDEDIESAMPARPRPAHLSSGVHAAAEAPQLQQKTERSLPPVPVRRERDIGRATPRPGAPYVPPPAPAVRQLRAAVREVPLTHASPTVRTIPLRSGARSESGTYLFAVFVLAIVAAGGLALGVMRMREAASEEDRPAWKIDLSPLRQSGHATLQVITDPPDAEVLLDGALVKPGGTRPFQSDHVESAVSHEVVARKAGYHAARETVVVSKGESREVRLTLEAGQPLVTITTVPPGAHIFIDGLDSGRSGGPVATLTPGVHTVRAELNCFATVDKNFTVNESTDSNLTLTLAPLKGSCIVPVTKPTDPGFLQLVAHPSAHVFIDGQDSRRDTPLIDFPLAPGHHTLRLVTGDEARVIDIDVRAGQSVSKAVAFR